MSLWAPSSDVVETRSEEGEEEEEEYRAIDMVSSCVDAGALPSLEEDDDDEPDDLVLESCEEVERSLGLSGMENKSDDEEDEEEGRWAERSEDVDEKEDEKDVGGLPSCDLWRDRPAPLVSEEDEKGWD